MVTAAKTDKKIVLRGRESIPLFLSFSRSLSFSLILFHRKGGGAKGLEEISRGASALKRGSM